MGAWPHVDDLWTSCNSAAASVFMELELDIFGESAQTRNVDSLQAILQAAKSDWGMKIPFLALRPELAVDSITQLDIRRTTNAEGAIGASDAFLQVVNAGGESLFAGRENHFLVLRSTRSRFQNVARAYLWMPVAGRNDVQTRFHLGRKSRLRIAFELAQACLLFLNTDWFSTICTCHVKCGSIQRNTLLDYEFGLPTSAMCMPDSEHNNAAQVLTAGVTVPTQSIRRLCLMLIEVWHLAMITDVRVAETGAIQLVQMKGDNGLISKSYDAIFESNELPDLYKKALQHCHTSSFNFQTIGDQARMKNAVKLLYEEVVQP